MKKNNTPKYRFLEVGVSIKSSSGRTSEYYLVFAVPYSLCMRRAKSGDNIRSLSVEDWLALDFSAILAYHLNISSSCVECFYIKPFYRDTYFPVSIHHASSLPSSWVNPFIYEIAQTYANKFICK